MHESRTVGKLGLAVVAAAVLMLGMATTAEAGARNIIFEGPDYSTNPCNGEPLLGFIRIHALTSSEFDAAGGVHGHFLHQINGTAESLVSDDQYVIHDVYQGGFNAGPGIETTLTESFQVTGKGDSPDFRFHGVYHLSVTPDGDVAVQFERTGETCD